MARRVGFGADAPPERRRSRVAILLLLLWLAALTALIAFVGRARLAATEGAGPMTAWLAVAGLGWLFGLLLLRRAIRGRPPRPTGRRPDVAEDPHGGPGRDGDGSGGAGG